MPTPLASVPSLPLLTAEEMRGCESLAIEAWGIASATLQEHAAIGALALLPPGEPIYVLAGLGNNGGDALALARLAKLCGRDIEVWTTEPEPKWKGDAALQAKLWQGLGGGFRHAADPGKEAITWDGWVVDGLLGLGTMLPLREEILPWIGAINSSKRRFKVLALDMPTGLDPSSGCVSGPVVRADKTACFGYLKRCHGLMPARVACGEIYLVPIPLGPGSDNFPGGPGRLGILSEPALVKPAWNTNKYDNGHIAIRAGAKGMSGAAVLAAMGALRGGAGLVTVLAEAGTVDIIASQVPEAMVKPWEGRLPETTDVLLTGPGGIEDVPEWQGPLIVDASALKSGDGPKWMARPNTVITPHSGEFSRLFCSKVGDSSDERLQALSAVSEGLPGIIVLKGAQTLIAGGGSGFTYLNPTGHSGLSTGGTGDFLAGLIAARVTKNLGNMLAATTEAVWLHGSAADRLGHGPLIVRELGASLAQILRDKFGA
ncbi:MAG: NAD(P)H-hydrate dehydratase [Holophagaceae bacterium]|nr:NAD(P)H-hydrate dehydratase [Holophagaceae bacterium]